MGADNNKTKRLCGNESDIKSELMSEQKTAWETLIKNSFIKYSQLLNIINNKLKDQFSKNKKGMSPWG